MAVNPYEKFLEGRDPRAILPQTPVRLRELATSLGAAALERPLAPGKWSVREILCHLADTEIVFAFRLRQTQAEDHHLVQPFDQDVWARNYSAYDADSALRMFTAIRDWNLRFITSVPDDRFGKRLTHPERGEMTFRVLVETMAGHDLNHLQQIEAAASNERV
jgi:hypothetical protein